MEININCDLGEKSKFHSIKNDPELLNIVNSANIACGYHAGDEQTMDIVIQISKKNGVSMGAHPSFNDPENFGRKRMNLNSLEIKKLIFEQYEILQKIAQKHNEHITHIKPHGALNNMACEDLELATTLALAIKEINKDIIYLVPTGSQMEVAAKNNKILFVGTKRTATNIIKNEAIRCSMPYVNERWLGGMLTNYKTIRSSITRLENLLRQKEDGTFSKLTKKEGLKKMNY